MSHIAKEGSLEGAPFVVKTFQLVTDPSTNPLVSWSETRDSFVVWKPVDFAAEVLPQYFKHNNFCSFIRQLNTYGFHKVEGKQWEFKHELFREGHGQLLKEIQRRKSKKRGSEKEDQNAPVTPNTPTTPVVTTTAVVREEPNKKLVTVKTEKDKETEVEKLKDLNQMLMREVLRLQQQQDSSQETINQILDQLLESRKETHSLHKKLAKFSSEVSQKFPGQVSLISPPPSPARPDLDHQNVANNYFQFSAPSFVNNNENLDTAPVISELDNSLLVNDPSVDNLINLGGLDLSIDQDLAKLLQNTLSPPQSPSRPF